MKKQNINPENAARLRQKAEEHLKLQKSKTNKIVSEAAMLKLIHELEVHQIELEMQNEELGIAKEKAELAEEKYKELYDFAPSGYLSISKEGEIIGLNFAAARMLGKERSNLIKNKFALFISKETLPVFNLFLQNIFTSKKKQSCEAILATKGDLPIYVNIDGILSSNDELCQLTVVDYTERKLTEIELIKAKEKVEESEERFALVIDASETGIWDWNIETNEVFFSEQWKRQIGYEDHEIKNDFGSWIELLHPNEKEACQNAVQTYLNNPVEHFFLEFRFRHKDGSYRWIHNKASSIKNKNGNVVRMFGVHTDITDHKLAELHIKHQNEELKKLNATKDKFFSIISHDLKIPFNSIMGFSELLIEQINEKDYDGIKKYAGIIHQSSQRAMELLMNLMDWSRSQTGRIKFNPERFDLTAFINDISLLFDDIAEQKRIVIKNKIPPNAHVFADQAMINTVLRNLISNAIKFTNPGGEIILSMTVGKKELTVSLKDNGIGIPNDRINKLFLINENFSTRGTSDEAGTGLGLLLCKEFIEKHKAKIWVESEEGIGTTFYFTLPYDAKPVT